MAVPGIVGGQFGLGIVGGGGFDLYVTGAGIFGESIKQLSDTNNLDLVKMIDKMVSIKCQMS